MCDSARVPWSCSIYSTFYVDAFASFVFGQCRCLTIFSHVPGSGSIVNLSIRTDANSLKIRGPVLSDRVPGGSGEASLESQASPQTHWCGGLTSNTV